MLYAVDAVIVSLSHEAPSSEKMAVIIVNLCKEFGLTVSKEKMETMCMPLDKYGAVRSDVRLLARNTGRPAIVWTWGGASVISLM